MHLRGNRISIRRNLLRANDAATHIPSLAPKSNLALYRDSILERGALFLLSFLLVRILPPKFRVIGHSYLRLGMDFEAFCNITKLLLQGEEDGDVGKVQVKIVTLLTNLMPEKVRLFFKETYNTNPKLLCEQSSQWIGFGFLTWLIGPTEPIDVDVLFGNEKKMETWKSGVKLVECRYLQQSGCKSTCVNICKLPTQMFFNEELGVPLRMTPNYDDCSCKFEFGIAPPALCDDVTINSPCFLNCSMMKKNKELDKNREPFVKCS